MTTAEMLQEIFQEYNNSHPVMDVKDYAFLNYRNSVEGNIPWSALTKIYREIYSPAEVTPWSNFSLEAMDYWSALLGKTTGEAKQSLFYYPEWRNFDDLAMNITHNVSSSITLARYALQKFKRAFLHNQADRFDDADKFTYLMTYGEEMKTSLYDEEYTAEEIISMWKYFETLTGDLATAYYENGMFIPKWPGLPSDICDSVRKAKLDKIWDSEEQTHKHRKGTFGMNPATTFVYRIMRVEGLQRVRGIYNSRDPGTQFAVIMGLGFDPEQYSIEIEAGVAK